MSPKISVQTEESYEGPRRCLCCDPRLLMDVEGESWLLCLNEHCVVTFFDRLTGRELPVGEWPIVRITRVPDDQVLLDPDQNTIVDSE